MVRREFGENFIAQKPFGNLSWIPSGKPCISLEAESAEDILQQIEL